MARVDSEQPRETSGLTVRLVLSYVRAVGGEAGVAEMLRRAGETRPLHVLENEREWYTYDTKIALFRAAAEVTGQPDIGRRVGSHVFASAVGPSVKLMLSMFGSPTGLLRHVAHANGKFTQCADLSAQILSPTSAIATYQLHEGYRPSHFDCDYTRGMLAQIPPMFGLPPAVIEHERCQVEGADACVYVLSWRPRRRRGLRRREHGRPLDAHVVHQRLQELQHAVSDLVGRDDLDLDAVLAHVVQRAAYAVGARAFVLAAQLDPGEEATVHAEGLPPQAAAEVAARLMQNGTEHDGEHDDEYMIVAPVRSAVHDYGRLAALAAAPFLPGELELLRAYAALAAAALDGLVARRETEERRRTAEILLAFASQVGAARHPGEVVRAAADAVRTLPGADVACVLLAGPGGELRVAGHTGFTAAEAARLDRTTLDPQALPDLARLLSAPHQVAMVDVLADGPGADRWIGGLVRADDVRHLGLVGLRCADHVHGLAVAGWRTRAVPAPLVERVLERLTGAGIQTTTGLDKTELLHQVQLQASTDALTGLTNRRHFLEVLGGEQARVTRENAPAGLLFLDLDGFKEVNDTFGHAAGDALLVETATRLQRCLEPGDVLARLGGDEFTLLSPLVRGEQDLLELAGRVLQACEVPIDVEGRTVVVRPSVGAALLRAGGRPDEALRAADEAMYGAKAAGGGCVRLAAPGLAAGARRLP